MYKIGDMVRHHVHYEVSVLAFVTSISKRSDSMDKGTRSYITISYLKPLIGHNMEPITNWFSISPHDQLTLVSCPESIPRIQSTL